MKQITQSLKSGEVEVASLPVPLVKDGQLLIKTTEHWYPLVLSGCLSNSERLGGLKACLQPDKIRMVLDKIKTDGIQLTLDAVLITGPAITSGYATGIAIKSGKVAYLMLKSVVGNGKHAEVVSVPRISAPKSLTVSATMKQLLLS